LLGDRDIQPERSQLCISALAVLLMVLFATAGLASASVTQNNAGTPVPHLTGPTPLPTPEVVSPENGEAAALHALATARGWAATVWRDYSGRLYIEQTITQTQRIRVMIRPFSFEAGALAAFLAEQEDARIGGYTVSPAGHRGFPAFRAVLNDERGERAENRLHWLSQRWILGVDTWGASFTESFIASVGDQFSELAAEHGLPAPAPRTPAPTPEPERSPTRPAPLPSNTPTPTETPAREPTSTSCTTFVDVPNEYWAAAYIREASCLGIISGYGDGTYRPQNHITRGQLVKMVVLSGGMAVVEPLDPTFSDVPRGHTFYRYIETANARRVVSGYADGTFRPDWSVTRAQIAKIVVRAKRWQIVRPTTAPACDVTTTHWAADYIYTAMRRGVFTGYADGCFHPDAPATRAQLAKILVVSR
jgi:hypothetical protein